MILDPQQIPRRTKLILAGLFLSKFDKLGLELLGFESFTEAFNVIGFALGGKPASIKNYRDEFDPLFPNPRAGWHQRRPRAYCATVLEDYQHLDSQVFAALIKSFVGYDEKARTETLKHGQETETAFARRLITGLAAERYFEAAHSQLSDFRGYTVENTTKLGCGYDFRLQKQSNDRFLAIEVKGLVGKTGSLALTAKEYEVAESLTDRFLLFVVKNFRETPYHEIYPNPLAGPLRFERRRRAVIQISWIASA